MRFGKKIDRSKGVKMPSICDSAYLHCLFLFHDLHDVIINYVPNGVRVLDVGCGNKPYKEWFEGKYTEYVGCDIEQSSAEVVDVLCEATNIPLPDQTFDVILCTQVIEHVFEHQKVFSEAYRLLAKGGVFIVSSNFVWPIHEPPYDYYRFTRFGFEELLKNAGFTVLEGKANGGKWAMMGVLCCRHLVPPFCETDFVLWRKFKTALRRSLKWIYNRFFLHLEEKYPDASDFTMNYIYVARK